MMVQRELSKSPIFLLLILLVFSFLAVMPVCCQVVVGPYDWVQVGAYVKYFTTTIRPNIVLPNGTIRRFRELHSPVLFEWTIVDKQGSVVRLNLTLFIEGRTYVDDFNITYHKILFVDVDVYTRESSVNGEPIGKTCFWADPYKEVGDKVTVFSDPDSLEADVWWVRTARWDYVGKEVKMYGASLHTYDPNAKAYGSYVFSWYAGVAMEPTFFGPPWEVPPEQIGNFLGSFENGTEYNVTRYAGTKLGTHLGLAPQEWLPVTLNETNIDLTLETNAGPPPEPLNLWQYLPYAFVATFAITATSFIIMRRRHYKQRKNTSQIT